VRAAAANAGRDISLAGPTVTQGETLYVGAFGYSVNGVESVKGTAAVVYGPSVAVGVIQPVTVVDESADVAGARQLKARSGLSIDLSVDHEIGVAFSEDMATQAELNAVAASIPTSTAPSGPAGGVLSGTYPDPDFAANMATQAELDAAVAEVEAEIPTTSGVGFEFGDGVNGPTVNTFGTMLVPFACHIDRSKIWGDVSGNAEVKWEVSTDSGATWTSITGGSNPALTAEQSHTDSTLTGWTTAIAADSILKGTLLSVATCKQVNSQLRLQKD